MNWSQIQKILKKKKKSTSDKLGPESAAFIIVGCFIYLFLLSFAIQNSQTFCKQQENYHYQVDLNPKSYKLPNFLRSSQKINFQLSKKLLCNQSANWEKIPSMQPDNKPYQMSYDIVKNSYSMQETAKVLV